MDQTETGAQSTPGTAVESGDRVFLTGGTGFIGSRLLTMLVERGCHVRVLARRANVQPHPAEKQDRSSPGRIEIVLGDLEDPGRFQRALAGCRWVFHLAGYAKNWSPNPETYRRLNIDAACRIFDMAGESGVERTVWTSSVVTFGPTTRGQVGDERMLRTTDQFFTEYEASKYEAERRALVYAASGLPLVIVNPTRVFGPGPLTEGNSVSRLIDDYNRGRVPILLNRGVNVGNYVLADDVARGMIRALEKGRLGERYILGSENVTLKEFFRLVDQASGKRHVQIPLMKVAPLVFAHFQRWRAERYGVYPQITPGWMRTFMTDWAYSCDKARNELGYQPTPLARAVRLTYEWLQSMRKNR